MLTWTSHIYTLSLRDFTQRCYDAAMSHFQPGSAIIDIGIGNGTMLGRQQSVIKSKGLRIVGIDINESYLEDCRRKVETYGLTSQVQVFRSPVETFEPPDNLRFDYALFSMSFTLLKDPLLVLERLKDLLKPDGRIIFVHTMFEDRSRFMEMLKPRLRYFTTIEFGKVMYERDFYDMLRASQLCLETDEVLTGSLFGGKYRMFVARWAY